MKPNTHITSSFPSAAKWIVQFVCTILLIALSVSTQGADDFTPLVGKWSVKFPSDPTADGSFEFTGAKWMTRKVREKTYTATVSAKGSGQYETSYGEEKGVVIFQIDAGQLKVEQWHSRAQFIEGLPPYRTGHGSKTESTEIPVGASTGGDARAVGTGSLEGKPIVASTAADPTKTDAVGGKGGKEFSEQKESGHLLGIKVWLGNFAGHRAIRGVQPLFEDGSSGERKGSVTGESVELRPKAGYAVGGMVAKGGDRVDGFKLIFMRVSADHLDATDSYDSEWVGGKGGGAEVRLAGTGTPVVGVWGGSGADLDRIGLVIAPTAPMPKAVVTPTVPIVPAATPLKTTPQAIAKASPAISVPAPKLALASGWDTAMQGASSTMNDLSKLFGELAKAEIHLDGDPSIHVYEEITYLMPARAALQTLKVNVLLPSKSSLSTGGFPRGSLYAYSVDGRFDGHYNRLYLVVDRADQVVSVQLVDETPKASPEGRDEGWHTYNFVNDRHKALATLRIDHRVAVSTEKTRFDQNQSFGHYLPVLTARNAQWTMARVDSCLFQPTQATQPSSRSSFPEMQAKEQVRWYVPRPIVELILTCVQKTVK